jgi:hypothetical protein
MKQRISQLAVPLSVVVSATMLFGTMGSALAIPVETGNSDIALTWGNSLRYNIGKRMKERSSVIGNSSSNDEGDYLYDKGDIVTNRIDLLTEIDFDYKRLFGARLTGAAWKDAAFRDDARTNPAFVNRGSYINNHFSSYTKRFHKQGGEILDAYVYTNLDLGGKPANVKLGRQVVLWGEAVALSTHSVSYAQAPSDGLKALTTPGVDAKETSMPVGQVSGSIQVLPNVSVAAQYYYEWRPTRVAEGGTYLAGTDFILSGPERFSLSPTTTLVNRGISEAKNSGEWGTSVRWQPSWFDGTLGAYYRRYHERGPTVSLNVAGGSYRAVYPEGAKLVGFSLAKSIGGMSSAAEIVYRENTALNSSISNGASEGARGNTLHVLLNGIKQWGPTSLWDSATLTAEFGYSRLQSISSGESFFTGCYKRAAGDQGAGTGCSSKENSQIFLRFGPSWTAVWSGWDIGGSANVLYGLKGNSPVPGGGNEKAGSFGLGTTFTYNNKYDFSLNYNGYLATNEANAAGAIRVSNGGQIQDRNWLSFTAKTSF